MGLSASDMSDCDSPASAGELVSPCAAGREEPRDAKADAEAIRAAEQAVADAKLQLERAERDLAELLIKLQSGEQPAAGEETPDSPGTRDSEAKKRRRRARKKKSKETAAETAAPAEETISTLSVKTSDQIEDESVVLMIGDIVHFTPLNQKKQLIPLKSAFGVC